MALLTYTAIASLDGYVADVRGRFDWAEPDEEVHAFVNDLQRPVGTYLYGRRLYEAMSAWETLDLTGQPEVMTDFAALWRAADKIVYSSSLSDVTTARTRLVRSFDPDAVRQLKESAGHDLSVGGPGLAGEALYAGLVDEIHVVLVSEVVGGGTSFLPPGVRLSLALQDERRFGNGTVYLRYEVRA
jgi:dihydrofolate reductase